MPSGRVHVAFSIAGGIAAGTALYLSTNDWASGTALGIGCAVAGAVVTPDLDVKTSPTHSNTVVRQRLGVLPSILWWILWLPYGWLIPHHRSFFSHFPVVGTLGRAGYLGIFLIPIGWVAQRFMPALPWPGLITWIICFALFCLLVVLSLLRVEPSQGVQKGAFWFILLGTALGFTIWALLAASRMAVSPMAVIPFWLWALLGLVESDSLHILADWYFPKFLANVL